jgi:hypothetical protein
MYFIKSSSPHLNPNIVTKAYSLWTNQAVNDVATRIDSFVTQRGGMFSASFRPLLIFAVIHEYDTTYCAISRQRIFE